MKVAIVQRGVPHYRRPIFSLLAQRDDIELTVLHTVGHGGCHGRRCSEWNIGGLRWQRIGQAIRRQSWDVIIFNYNLRYVSSIVYSVVRRERALLWGHGRMRGGFTDYVRHTWGKAVGQVAVYSQAGKTKLVRAGFDKRQVAVIRNTLLVPNYGRCRWSRRDSFIFCGTLARRKRLDELLYAFAKVRQKVCANLKLLIVGDGEERDFLGKLIQKLDIDDSVQLLGKCYDHDKLKLLFSRAIAYVSPGHVGLGLLHSFAYGVPVITRKSENHAPEYHNLRNGQNGIAYSGGHERLSLMMTRLVKNRDLSTRMGMHGYRHYVCNRLPDVMVDDLVSAVRRVGS